MKIVIIGAGIGGLLASHELTKRGHEVEIYESTNRAGGRGRRMQRPGTDDWADVGSQYFVGSYDNILRVIDELGLSHKKRLVKGNVRFFTGPGPEKSFKLNPKRPWFKAGGIVDNLSYFWFAAKMLLTNKSAKYAPSPRGVKVDTILAAESTRSQFVRDYLLRFGTRMGLLNDLESSKVHALHIQHQLASFGTHPTFTLEGGTASLHAELAQRAKIHFETPVEGLIEQDGVVSGIKLINGASVAADHVIVAANAVHAAKLVPSNWALEKGYLSGIEQTPAIIVSLFLDGPLPEDDILSYCLPWGSDTYVSYCTDANQKGTGNTPSGKTTLQAWIVNPKSAELANLSDEEIVRIARQDIAPYMPHIEPMIESYAISRHPLTIPQFWVGHNERTHDFLDSVDQRNGVSFCGDYISNGNMESSAWCVQRLVKRLEDRPATSAPASESRAAIAA
ncbi:MAG: NAD(P)/FAD-dependent oxidoreductase [Pseudomonadota bacterium]